MVAPVLVEDVRECPATWSLAASWVLVFALMHLAQWGQPAPPANPASPAARDAIATTTSHRFGDMTWADVARGEPWRALTATFVHFSLLHLGMNLASLVMLGRLIEPWYGPGPFLATCLAIGGLGNLVGGALRQLAAMAWAGLATSGLGRTWPGLVDRLGLGGPSNPAFIHTGGGSTIVLGLLGLGAVVGWRSRTRIGSFLRDQMVGLLGFTALLGIVLHRLVDNYGHAGGAVVGAAIGFLHRPLIRAGERPSGRRAAWVVVAVLTSACLASAVHVDRAEGVMARDSAEASGRFRRDLQALQDLERLFVHYGRMIVRSPEYRDPALELDALAVLDLLARGPALTNPSPATEPTDPAQAARDRADFAQTLDRLDQIKPAPWDPEVADNLDRLRALGRAALLDTPRFEQVYEFVVDWKLATGAIVADRLQAEARLIELNRLAKGGR